MIRQTVVTGNTVLIYCNGVKVGRASNLSPSLDFSPEAVPEIGEFKPVEYVQLRFNGSFTLGKFLLKNESLMQAGIIPTPDNALKQPVLEFQVVDKSTGNPLFSFKGVTVGNYSLNIQVNAIVGENATFNYTDIVAYDKNGQPIKELA
jgi:hypothetical protein